MLIGYAANADRYEDWLTNPRPLRDSQQPFNSAFPLNTYPSGPLLRDTNGLFLVTGQIQDPVAAHTASDIPVYAEGRGGNLFRGTIDNTDVFFTVMQALIGGASKP
jgi:alkaline phosphatase